MKHVGLRSLPAAAQEERHRQVIGLRERGLSYQAIGRQVGLSRTGVFDTCKRWRIAGEAGLRNRSPGLAVGSGRLLSADQDAAIQALIRRHTPDALDLPFALWSRAAVRLLIQRRCGIALALHRSEAAPARL